MWTRVPKSCNQSEHIIQSATATIVAALRFYIRRFSSTSHLTMAGRREELMKYLDDLSIVTDVIEHPEVFTVEAMMPHLQGISGAVGKNLFLKDKKKKGLWLLSALVDREVNLGKISKMVSAPGGLRFADESVMIEKLGVSQGCCTAYSLFNDKEGDVKFILDLALYDGSHERVYFHPMVNTATLGMSTDDFKRFLTATGHDPILVNFDDN